MEASSQAALNATVGTRSAAAAAPRQHTAVERVSHHVDASVLEVAVLLPGRAGVAGVRARAEPRQRVAAKVLQQRAAASHLLHAVRQPSLCMLSKLRSVVALQLYVQ